MLGVWQSVLFTEFSSVFRWQFQVSKSMFLQTSALVAGLSFRGGIGGSLLLLPHKVTLEDPGDHAQEVLSRGCF